MLKLTPQQQAEMEQAAIAAYPQECCGILLGKICAPDSTSDLTPDPTDQSGKPRPAPTKQVTQVWPTENAWTPTIEAEFRESLGLPAKEIELKAHSQGDRFWIDPRELLRAQKFARSQNWVIVGIYHSHPNHPAVPSERDRLSAWSDYSYVILSVQAKRPVGGAEQPTGQAEQPVKSEAIADCRSWILDEAGQFHPEAIGPDD